MDAAVGVSGRGEAGPRSPVLPWVAAAVGVGAVAAESPEVAAGAGALALLACLPWLAVFVVMSISALLQRWTIAAGGLTLRPDEVVVLVFAFRAFILSRRARLGRPELLLVAFMVVQLVTSLMNAADVRKSLLDAVLLGLGALAFLSVSVALSNAHRCLVASRWFLGTLVAAAAIGIAGLAAYYVAGATLGITRVDTLRGFPAATGLAYEHDLFGSMCAAGALVFIVLWRECSELFSRRVCSGGAWVCLAGLLLSLARGAWVAFVAGLVLYIVLMPGAGRRSLVSLVVAGALAAGIIAGAVAFFGSSQEVAGVGSSTAATIGTQASQALDFEHSTGAHRLVEWKGALHEVTGSWLLGLGTNSWGQRHFEITQFGPIPAFLGNWVIRTLYDSGVIGLVFLCAFFVTAVWPGKAVRVATGDTASVARALAFGSIALLVAYLATDALLLVWPWLFFALARSASRLASTSSG